MIKQLILWIGLLAITGCTSNPTVLKLLYGQFDNVLKRELLSFAEFDAEQKVLIRKAVDETVLWHQVNALPDYAGMASDIQTRLLDQPATAQEVEWLFNTMSQFAEDFEAQSPILKLLPVLQSLTDEQVVQVADKIDEEFAEQEEQMEKLAGKDLAEESTRELTRNLKRIGLKLNQEQKQQAQIRYRQRRLSEAERLIAWRGWADELLTILSNRSAPDFQTRFKQHYFSRSKLIESVYPEALQHDRNVAQTLTLELFQSLNQAQKDSMRKRFSKLSKVALDLAAQRQPLTLQEF